MITGTCDPASTATTSFDKIDEALANGLLDLETSIEMKAFAEFNDPRLTSECRGDDSDVFEGESLGLISENWDALSDNARAILGPFTWPPVYVGSWASPAPRAKRGLKFCDFPDVDPNWAFLPISGGSFKVWYDQRGTDAGKKAQTVLHALENEIVPMDTSIGMKAPLDDASNAGCNGGDGRLDVFLVDMATHGVTADDLGETKTTMTGGKQQRPTFILLNVELSEKELKHTVAHEYFHAIQWAYPLAGSGLRQSYRWLLDATAEWNADWIYADDLSKERAPSYVSRTFESLDLKEKHHIYGSYLFFRFLTQSTGDPSLIRRIWENAAREEKETLAVDKVIPGGFKKQWPKFAKLLWNADPVQDEAAMTFDNLVGYPPIIPDHDHPTYLTTGAEGAATTVLKSSKLPHLAIRYYQFLVDPNDLSARSIAFGSPSDHIGVQAFVKVEGGIREWKDWNDLGVRPDRQNVHWCTDAKAERLVELILIVTNDSPTDDNDSLIDLLLPRFTLSSVGCWRYQGTTSVRTATTSDQLVTSTVTLEVDHAPTYANDYFLHWMVKSGAGHASLTSDDGFGCHTEETGNGPLTTGEAGGSVDISEGLDFGVPLPGSRVVSNFDGVATLGTDLVMSGSCGFSSQHFDLDWTWFEPPMHEILVRPDGTWGMTVTEAEKTFSYVFTPLRE